MDIFTTFKTTPYTFLAYGQGGIYGNTTSATFDAEGVFKLRRGVSKTAIGEDPNSSATLHIKPLEGFVDAYKPLEGNGIKVGDNEYRIVGVTEGMNYDTNVLEHITVTLQAEDHTNV